METQDLMQYAFRALAQRALTAHELRERLHRRGGTDEQVEHVLSRLMELGYVNDQSLARAVTTRRGVGAMRLRHDLTRRGIDRDTVDEAIATRDPDTEVEDIANLIERNRARWERASDPTAKAFGFLARRGFRSDLIWSALREAGLRASRDA